MNLNNNKTLEELENSYWGPPPADATTLITRIHEVRKKKLKDLTIEDLRITIGQSFSLEILIPLAVERLKENILAEGNYFEGDLLKNVLDADVNFWKSNHDLWISVKTLFESNLGLFHEKEHRQILKSFKKFEVIHHAVS